MKKILVAILLFILLVPALESSLAAEDLVIPKSYEHPPYQFYYQGCECESNDWTLDNIYYNQLVNEMRNRPGTIKEIEDNYYKLSGGN